MSITDRSKTPLVWFKLVLTWRVAFIAHSQSRRCNTQPLQYMVAKPSGAPVVTKHEELSSTLHEVYIVCSLDMKLIKVICLDHTSD
jgi:hypothetical protein